MASYGSLEKTNERDSKHQQQHQSRALGSHPNGTAGVEVGGGNTINLLLKVALGCALACALVALRAREAESPTQGSISFASTRHCEGQEEVVLAADSKVKSLAFTATNFYHTRDGKPASEYPWLQGVKLIEPHRKTTLRVTGARDGFNYRWTVVRSGAGGDAGEVELAVTGEEAVVVLKTLGEHVIVLEEVDAVTGVVARRLEEGAMVKYVRREIRTLTDDEREELLDAVS